MSTLPEDALEDFCRLGRSVASGSGRRIVFDCDMQTGRPVLLKSSDAAHPIWIQVAAAIDAGLDLRTGVALECHLVLLTQSGPDRPARIVVMPDAEILGVLQGMTQGKWLTGSELRLLKQLICGWKLSEAADRDGVSHETKRTQFKSLSRKIGARSQVELTNKALMHILLTSDSFHSTSVEPDEHFIDLLREFIPSARPLHLWSPNGVKHRLVDLGPISGRPVAMVHSQILPDIRPADIDLLHDYGILLIVPLRNGAMSRADLRLDVEAHLDHACDGIDLVRTHFCGERVDLLLCISGCAYGIEYARRTPDRMRSLGFVGACVRPITNASTAGRLRSGLLSLAVRHWGFFSGVLEFYGRRIRQPAAFRRLMHDMFRPSQADLAVVMAEYASPHGGERGRTMFTASIESMKHDFYHQALPRWESFPAGEFPTAFFHGSQDFIHPIQEVQGLAKSYGDLPVHVIPGAGQLIYHRHFEPLLRAYSIFISGPLRDRLSIDLP